VGGRTKRSEKSAGEAASAVGESGIKIPRITLANVGWGKKKKIHNGKRGGGKKKWEHGDMFPSKQTVETLAIKNLLGK